MVWLSDGLFVVIAVVRCLLFVVCLLFAALLFVCCLLLFAVWCLFVVRLLFEACNREAGLLVSMQMDSRSLPSPADFQKFSSVFCRVTMQAIPVAFSHGSSVPLGSVFYDVDGVPISFRSSLWSSCVVFGNCRFLHL